MKTFNKPDLNAPRFREKRKSVLTAATLKEFQKKYPKYKDVSLSEFKSIIMTFNNQMVEGVIENRNGVELPEGLGYVFMGTCPPPKRKTGEDGVKKKNIDSKKSAELGVQVSYRNMETNGNIMKIFYTNNQTKYPFHHKQLWSFSASKDTKRKMSDAFSENWQKYIMVDPTQKISRMYDRYRKKEQGKNLTPIVPDGYDEFNL